MNNILGLIITFNPPPNFFSSLDTFNAQLDQIIIVDNGSSLEVHQLLKSEAQNRHHSLTVLFNKTNQGVAAALNQGFQWAINQGYRQIFTFDQDGQPEYNMISTMLNVYDEYSKDDTLAVLAPVVIQPAVNIRSRYLRPKNKFLFERVSCDENVLNDVTYVITSGSLYDLEAYQKIGPFRDDFFIDFVDTEFCLRAREMGYRIVVACNAYLNHNLGEQKKRKFLGWNFYPTFHSKNRWYYISRNRIWMFRRYLLRFPHWVLFELGVSINSIIRMLLFEDHRISKFLAILSGTLDGLSGKMGKMPGNDKMKRL